MNPARTLGPDIVANDFTGWWVYDFGPFRRHHRVMLIGLVRGLPDKEEREAAEGSALPLSTEETAHNSALGCVTA